MESPIDQKCTLEYLYNQLKITNELSSIIDNFRIFLQKTHQSYKSKSEKILKTQKLGRMERPLLKIKTENIINHIKAFSNNVESNYANNVKEVSNRFSMFVKKLEKLYQGEFDYTEEELLSELHEIKDKIFRRTLFSANIKNLFSSNNSHLYIDTLIQINVYLDDFEIDTLLALLQLAQETNIDWPIKIYNEKKPKLSLKKKKDIVLNNRVFLIRDLWDYINLVARQKDVILIKIDRLFFSKELSFNKELRIDLIQADTFKYSKPTKDLVQLNLSNIELCEFELNAFAGLDNLEQLDLSCNNLTQLNKFPKLKRLIHLNLEKNHIRIVERNVFENLSQLNILNLSNNKIISIQTESFQGLTNLEKLNLSKNEIKNLEQISFEKLINLVVLNLSETSIKSVNTFIFNSLTRLRYLLCRKNKLLEIKNCVFESLVNLLKLDLGENKIKYIEPKALCGLSNLVLLDLSHNNLDIIPNFPSEYLKNLRFLLLDKNKINQFDKSKLYDLKKLEQLSLSKNNMEIDQSSRVSRVIANVDIFGGSFASILQNVKIFPYMPFIKRTLCFLTELDLSFCNLNRISVEMLAGLKKLEILLLNDNKIKMIETGCFKNVPLKLLDLKNNNFENLSQISLFGLKKGTVVYLSTTEFSVLCQQSLLKIYEEFSIKILFTVSSKAT